jgi:hypothetical protein
MSSPVSLFQTFPVYKVEYDCVLSKKGDVTLAYEVSLPEIFTLSDQEYEAFHQTLVKAVKVLPPYTIFHKQDWFITQNHKGDFEEKDLSAGALAKEELSFLSGSSERFFNERPFLNHKCYIMLTRKPLNRKPSADPFSGMLCKSIVSEETLKPQRMQEFFDSAG